MPYKPGLPAIWQAGLGQGHNQKKDTHTLDFDVTLYCQGLCLTQKLDNNILSHQINLSS